MEVVRAFAVFFGEITADNLLGAIVAPNLEEVIASFELTPCSDYVGNRCSPKLEPHAHVPAALFREQVTRDGADYLIGRVPPFREISFPVKESEPPPVFFVEIPMIYAPPRP